jgi:hypothetical protein
MHLRAWVWRRLKNAGYAPACMGLEKKKAEAMHLRAWDWRRIKKAEAMHLRAWDWKD